MMEQKFENGMWKHFNPVYEIKEQGIPKYRIVKGSFLWKLVTNGDFSKEETAHLCEMQMNGATHDMLRAYAFECKRRRFVEKCMKWGI